MNSQNLLNYFKSNQGRVIHKWYHYFEIYERHFEKYVGTDCVILEIGISKGGSLQMWKDYFGKKAKIYAIDIDPDCKQYEDDQVTIFIGSQSDRDFLNRIIKKIPKLDILIDDGGHMMDQQIISFETLYSHVKNDGIYLCEDTHTSYWETYGGGLRKSGTFIEYTKKLVDQLNAWHIQEDHDFSPVDISKTAHSIHYYDSIFVIEKKERTPPYDEMIGTGHHSFEKLVTDEQISVFLTKLKLMGIQLPDNSIPHYLYDNHIILSRMFPDKYEGNIWPETAETMIGYKRLSNIEFCVSDVVKNNIKGDLIETGVWRGGACIFMKFLLETYGVTDRNVWLADSFLGLPKPNISEFSDDEGLNLYEFEELAVSRKEVEENFRKYNLLDSNVKFLEGWFKDTLPDAPVNQLSVLRLDGDLYESTIQALFYLYPKLSLGGYCIIDDWGAIPACKQAVEDYRNVFKIKDKIETIDWTGIYWKKQKDVKNLSWKQFRKKLNKPSLIKNLFRKQ